MSLVALPRAVASSENGLFERGRKVAVDDGVRVDPLQAGVEYVLQRSTLLVVTEAQIERLVLERLLFEAEFVGARLEALFRRLEILQHQLVDDHGDDPLAYKFLQVGDVVV